jgi:hypothetical protein
LKNINENEVQRLKFECDKIRCDKTTEDDDGSYIYVQEYKVKFIGVSIAHLLLHPEQSGESVVVDIGKEANRNPFLPTLSNEEKYKIFNIRKIKFKRFKRQMTASNGKIIVANDPITGSNYLYHHVVGDGSCFINCYLESCHTNYFLFVW